MKHNFSVRIQAALLGLCAFTLGTAARADVKLPAIFSEHMVLQQDKTIPVWGWADPGEAVSVHIANQTKTTHADADGKWTVNLDPLHPGQTYTLTVNGKNSLVVQDVLVGEVWLCSGQSNMAMTVNRAQNFEAEKAAAKYPKIRMFKEGDGPATTPQERGKGVWVVCSPDTVGGFSAAGYFFGREIHEKLGVPVGLINSSVGGTAIEAWTSWPAQKDKADLKPIFDRWATAESNWDPAQAQAQYQKQQAAWKTAVARARAAGKQPPRAPRRPEDPRLSANHPATLFNGKIMPIIPYALRGAIWYQGESNAGRGDLYELQLTTMIQDWRARWGDDFPFAWVQLPNFHRPQVNAVEDTGWVRVRDGMLKALRLPHTGMAITLDLGEADNIHPKNKQAVGQRLALWALAEVYHKKGFEWSGPLPSGHQIRGDEIVVSFQHTDDGLVAKGGELKGFAIAGADHQWVKAKAKIDGKQVIVSSPEVKQPVAVRYAWADNPEFSLYNGAGLPASPFRTDDWPVSVTGSLTRLPLPHEKATRFWSAPAERSEAGAFAFAASAAVKAKAASRWRWPPHSMSAAPMGNDSFPIVTRRAARYEWFTFAMKAMKHITALLVLSQLVLVAAASAKDWVVYQGKEGPGKGKHIVFLSGDEEYRSEEALPMLAKILAERHGFTCTVLFAINPADGTITPTILTNIPGMAALDTADLCVMALRFRELPDAQMKHFVDYVNAGKPIIGLRTATHSFYYVHNKQSPYAKYSWENKDWPGGFGQQVLGETWVSHHGSHGKESTRGIINEAFKNNPILRGVSDIWVPTDVYTVADLGQDAHVLIWGQVLSGMAPTDAPVQGLKNHPMMPLVWTREYTADQGKTCQILDTTMGAAVDLKNEGLRRLLVNACYWATGLADEIPAHANVNYVGEYNPLWFGFGKHKPGVKPEDLELK